MGRLLVRASALFCIAIFAGRFIPTPPIAVDEQANRLTQIHEARPYLETVTPGQLLSANSVISIQEANLNARFTGMLLHLKWLIAQEGTTGSVDKTLFDKQVQSLLDDTNDDIDDLREELTGVTSSLTSDDVTPDYVAAAGQTDEFCLTYELTGDTWEWQTCSSGSGGLATTSIDTSAELRSILTDETGTGALVFAASPTLSGPLTAAAANFSGNVGVSTSSPWQELSVNGDLALTGRIYDSLASAGTSGMVLQTTGTATRWVATSSLGIAGGASLLTDGGANTYVTATADNFSIGGSGGLARLNVYGDIDVANNNSGISFMGTRVMYASSTNNSLSIGTLAGSSLTSATTYNVALGYEAGRSMNNTNADYMLMLGYQAGHSNTGDHTNIVGFGSGFSNSGDYTNIFGQSAGLANSGDYSNLIGAFSGRNNTGGFNNFIGHSVGFSNTGNYNNFIGYYTGYNNTGDNNDFVGYQAGRYLLSSSTVAIGAEALYGSHATTFISGHNVAIGYRAGYTADDGSGRNILIGYQAADNLTTGNNNIIIGYDINNVTAAADNRLNIGNLIFGTGLDGTGTTLASGNIGIGTTTPAQKLQVAGNIRVGTAGGNGCLEDFAGTLIAGTCSSDEELKENIVPIAKEGRSYLEAMAALTPVTYTWNETAGELYSKDTDFENLGLLAQDVETQFPELVSLNDEGYRQVNFSAFPFYIIEALKEVWQKIQGHNERIETLEQENDYLKERIENIEDELNIEPAPEPEPIIEEVAPSGSVAEEPVTTDVTEVTDEPEPVIEKPSTEPTYVLVPAESL